MKPPADGQILPDSPFGQMLTRLARMSDSIVEIGTWNGGGSTLCLANGLERPAQRLYTVEADPGRHAEAKARYDDPRIIFIYGTVSPMNNLPIVTDKLPMLIQLLLIDGGDGNGRADFELLWERSELIALDDVNEFKNRANREFLIRQGWITIAESLVDRNGWSIFKRAEHDAT